MNQNEAESKWSGFISWFLILKFAESFYTDLLFSCFMIEVQLIKLNSSTFAVILKNKTYLLGLGLKCGRQHFWEEFEEYGEQKLHERNDDKDHEGQEPE